MAAITNIHKHIQCMWAFGMTLLAGAGIKNALWAFCAAIRGDLGLPAF